MSAAKSQAAYDAFAARFLLPLLRGEKARIDRPIGPGVVPHFALTKASDSAVEEALNAVLATRANAFCARMNVVALDRDALLLALVGYDLAALTDSSLDVWPATRARPVIARWVEQLLGEVTLPTSEGAALARHLVVDAVLTLFRRDVTTSTWGMEQVYKGRVAPADEDRQETLVSLADAVASLPTELGMTDVFRRMMARSPITELAHCKKLPDFRVSLATLGVLSSTRIRGALVKTLAVTRSEGALAKALLAVPAHHEANLDAYLALLLELGIHHVLSRSVLEPAKLPVDEVLFWSLWTELLRDFDIARFDLSRNDSALVVNAREKLMHGLSQKSLREMRTVLTPSLSRTRSTASLLEASS